jgi:hypothetical protein
MGKVDDMGRGPRNAYAGAILNCACLDIEILFHVAEIAPGRNGDQTPEGRTIG